MHLTVPLFSVVLTHHPVHRIASIKKQMKALHKKGGWGTAKYKQLLCIHSFSPPTKNLVRWHGWFWEVTRGKRCQFYRRTGLSPHANS